MSDKELIKKHIIFFAYFCHLIEQDLTDLPKELYEIGWKLEDEIRIRKISNAEIDDYMEDACLSPEDQLMVGTYIYPDSNIFSARIGQC